MTFQLKEIKKYKKILKEKEEVLLASIFKKKETQIKELEEKKLEYLSVESKIRDLYNKNFNISLVRLYNDNLELINTSIEEIKKEIKKTDKKIEEQKIVIQKSTIEFKKFEKLEENYLKEKAEEIKYNEKKELDEIVSIREFHKE